MDEAAESAPDGSGADTSASTVRTSSTRHGSPLPERTSFTYTVA